VFRLSRSVPAFRVGADAPASVTALVALVFAALTPLTARAADPYNGTPSPIVEPVCIDDAESAFVRDAAPPEDRFTLSIRHLGDDALAVPAAYDFSSLEGVPLTNFRVPAPRGAWQRAKSQADPNFTSAFQLHCADAGIFINTWQFEPQALIDEGPHVAYAFAFSDMPPAFDADPGTDLAIQAQLEVPWLYRPQGQAVALAYFQLRFLDMSTGRFLQTTFLLFDDRGVGYAPYADYARNDSLFVSAPADTSAVVTRSPFSAAPSEQAWTGLRFFRSQITQDNFRSAIDLANAFCRDRSDIPDCAVPAGRSGALSRNPADYRIAEMGFIAEIFDADQDRNGLSLGLHLSGLGLYRFR